MNIIDAYDQTLQDNMLNSLNKSQTMFDLLTSETAKIANAIASAVTDIAGDIMSGDFSLGSLADSAATAVNFLGPNVAGVWTISTPVITAVDFGDFNYTSTGINQIKLTIAYNNFKYEKSLL